MLQKTPHYILFIISHQISIFILMRTISLVQRIDFEIRQSWPQFQVSHLQLLNMVHILKLLDSSSCWDKMSRCENKTCSTSSTQITSPKQTLVLLLFCYCCCLVFNIICQVQIYLKFFNYILEKNIRRNSTIFVQILGTNILCNRILFHKRYLH